MQDILVEMQGSLALGSLVQHGENGGLQKIIPDAEQRGWEKEDYSPEFAKNIQGDEKVTVVVIVFMISKPSFLNAQNASERCTRRDLGV